MYHTLEDHEQHPENYVLSKVHPNFTEDECFDFISKPRQTQTTVGMYLKKRGGNKISDAEMENRREKGPGESSGFHQRRDPTKLDPYLEKRLSENKGFWVDKPTVAGPLTYKLRELYSVELPSKNPRKGQGIFYRPHYLELDYLVEMGKAGLLYPDEEITDSEEEVKPDETMCLPLRKKKYKICDPCKPKPEKKLGNQAPEVFEQKLPFKKIPFGCECNYYGDHNTPATVWDYPFENEVDMIRAHEMNKYLRPYKTELLNKNYEKNKPIRFTPIEPEAKRTFPDLMLSNL